MFIRRFIFATSACVIALLVSTQIAAREPIASAEQQMENAEQPMPWMEPYDDKDVPKAERLARLRMQLLAKNAEFEEIRRATLAANPALARTIREKRELIQNAILEEGGIPNVKTRIRSAEGSEARELARRHQRAIDAAKQRPDVQNATKDITDKLMSAMYRQNHDALKIARELQKMRAYRKKLN